ncbi:unnamed protein product [Candidula unifasciata]|uniref:Lactate/malate dehydrogenase C-terminal domain-containing protein n=1 Tax=Candidula unifasciata TaxID=100452 RepID=A0A8S3ZXW2_9EUPU|nr:unnamed protein product [Candidula unifasciata]
MAKIVLAGRSDCPYLARCELLGDRLARNLRKFKLHKIILQPEQWESWLAETCKERGWSFKKSPIVWRELIDRGGKGVLIGDANDFQEYAKAYYDVLSEMTTLDMNVVSLENKITKDMSDEQERYYRSLSQPITVCITNAGNPVCYYLLNSLVSGEVFGPDVEIIVHLLASSVNDYELVKGTAMEAEDLASRFLRGVKVFTNAHDAFEDCKFIISLDTLSKRKNESEKEWLERNEEFFSIFAFIINDKAHKLCKVLLCGNGPVNFNATIVAENAPNLPHQNIVVVSALIENYAKSVIAEKLNVNTAGVVNLIVWGNITGKYFLDLNHCRIHGYRGAVKGPEWYSVQAVEMIHDKKWIQKDLPRLVATRHLKTVEVEDNSHSGLCSANAIASMLQHWCRGSPRSEIFSLGVSSEGWYGAPVGMFFSFPVTMTLSGSWQVVQDIEVTKETVEVIEACIMEQGQQFLLCMGDRRMSESPKILDQASQSNDTMSLWSQLSLGRRSTVGGHLSTRPAAEVGAKFQDDTEEGKISRDVLKEIQSLLEENTLTPADVTLDPEDTIVTDNLSQSDSHPPPTDEDNTSLEAVTIEEVSTAPKGS